MSHLRSICRPNSVFSSLVCCKNRIRFLCSGSSRISFSKPNMSLFPSLSFDSSELFRSEPWFRLNHRRHGAKASNWTGEKSPYDVLELERDADEEQIKIAYRRLAKFYHPDVYDGRGNLEDGETAETRFIKIQAAYELLVDGERRREYDMENRVNPMKASEAWMEWLIKKRKAFDQRGDMAIAAWAEQQQREMNLRARQRARSKVLANKARHWTEFLQG
ncbi:Chaperone protein DnaJ [Bienertia sinuspersici]